MLHECNLFITLYKIVYKYLQDLDNLPEIWIILNPQICLLLKENSNSCYYNLSTTNKITIIIFNQYDRGSF